MKSFPEQLDESIFDATLAIMDAFNSVYPSDTRIITFLKASFDKLTPEQRVNIVQQYGAEWYVKLAAEVQRRQRQIDKAREK